MTILYIGLCLFFGLHVYSAFRSRITGADIKQKWGEAKYMGLYSLVSLLGLVVIIWGYSLTQPSAYVFNGVDNGRAFIPWLMVVAVLLLAASQLPTGFIKKTTKHPMLLAVAVWSVAHLIDGADLPQCALFGSFLVYSLIALVAVSQRETPVKNRAQIPHWRNDLFSVLITIVVYTMLVNGIHEWLFGVTTLV
ncbi:MAG: putative membrane protein [Arenicella sp.]|jgi:uncharacterized membrane protein